jgi:hypothetical protein
MVSSMVPVETTASWRLQRIDDLQPLREDSRVGGR